MTKIRKRFSGAEMLQLLCNNQIPLAPLALRCLRLEPKNLSARADALLEISWRQASSRFMLECKALSTPKIFRSALNEVKSWSLPNDLQSILFVPYLDEEQLRELEREKISGLDLCGNAVIAGDGFYFFRSGRPNPFSSTAPIKNVYRKKSSLVGRTFFARPGFPTVQAVWEEVNRRNLKAQLSRQHPLSLSTVSKVLSAMVEDLTISRNEEIRLLQADKLLDRLAANFNAPVVKQRVQLKVPDLAAGLASMRNRSRRQALPLVATGLSSVNRYAVMQQADLFSVYCPRIEQVIGKVSEGRKERFANLELVETDDEAVYFDAREDDEFTWASPLQVFLELSAGDKRDRETAEQVRESLINSVSRKNATHG